MKNLANLWSADLETTTDENDCRVWAYSLSNIENPDEFLYGKSLDELFEWCCESKQNYTLYFFNLKFDGSFILSWLFNHGFEHIRDKKDRRDFTFTTLITDMGQFYCIEIYFEVKGKIVNKVRILDAMKIFPNFSVEKIAKGFGLPIRKLEIDYNKHRPEGWEITPEEVDYIRNDVEIVARALREMFTRGLTKMTIASDAFSYYKEITPHFRRNFPLLSKEVDVDIRLSYKGGFTYCSPKYAGQIVGSGITLDVNSLYPSRMMFESMPYGQPRFFEGKYENDLSYPLYIQTFTCRFKIKPDKIPSIQLKNNLSFQPNEYLESSDDEKVTLTLTSPDFELFKEHYDFWDVEYHGGWKFKGATGLFEEYISYWMEQKIKASKEKNESLRSISKLLLNSLYGRFALSVKAAQKAPYMDSEGVVRFRRLEPEEREPCYIPVAAFITAYGRCKTIRSSQAVRDFSEKKYGYDAYLYSDTDSISCLLGEKDLEELKDIIDVDEYRLGAWAHENSFSRACFIHQKCYIKEIDGKLSVTVAGLPKYLAPLITFDNFKKGFTTEGLELYDMIKMASDNGASDEELKKLHHKLNYHYVKGGVVLEDTGFTIK